MDRQPHTWPQPSARGLPSGLLQLGCLRALSRLGRAGEGSGEERTLCKCRPFAVEGVDARTPAGQPAHLGGCGAVAAAVAVTLTVMHRLATLSHAAAQLPAQRLPEVAPLHASAPRALPRSTVAPTAEQRCRGGPTSPSSGPPAAEGFTLPSTTTPCRPRASCPAPSRTAGRWRRSCAEMAPGQTEQFAVHAQLAV